MEAVSEDVNMVTVQDQAAARSNPPCSVYILFTAIPQG
jgi:hypothetical protein